MKKFMMFMSVSIFFLMIPLHTTETIEAKNEEIKYRIFMDSTQNNTLEVKEDVLNIIAYLCDGVTSDTYATMIKSNLSLFEKIADSKVQWKNNSLVIKIGDGKGSLLNGKYSEEKVCLENVVPKSKIMEWLESDE